MSELWKSTDFAGNPEAIAQRLLGAVLVRVLDNGTRISGAIVETEAYLGAPDKAAHSYKGHRSPRNESMYAKPGTAYVYFTYGMHHCMNVVTGAEGEPTAVLLRALEPIEGFDAMERHRTARRQRSAPRLHPTDLCSGPAKLCQALSIDRELDGVDLTRSPSLYLERPARPVDRGEVNNGPRIGIGSAEEWVDRPLRWFFASNRHVSR